jgi:hypothetical protein
MPEIGEIDRFNDPKKLVAFAGVDPSVIEKREEGKPFKVAVIACVNKLLHWIFALLKNRITFQDIA